MGKPRLIILIRHGQSEGNKNREIHQTIPDHRVKLTPEGWQQAHEAGRRLRGMLRADDTLHFFTSPYRRTRETTEGILSTLTAPDPHDPEGRPARFRREHIKVYEEPRLREQDFGNFQPCSAAMERMWQERADYGHFFYRIPNGESAADAYDRVSGFNESLWRQFGEDGFASVAVLVTHGLMSRVFLMKWYHFTVEYFEDLRNINHCEFLVMRRDEERDKYVLQTKLRTWSELRRERAAAADREREKDDEDDANQERDEDKDKGDDKRLTNGVKGTEQTASTSPVEPRRRWGGCPNGCNHDKSFKIRKALADLIQCDSAACSDGLGIAPATGPKDAETANGTSNGTTTSSLASRRPAARRLLSTPSSSSTLQPPAGDASDAINDGEDSPFEDGTGNGGEPTIDVRRAREEVVSSPDGTPSYISVDDRLLRATSPETPPGASITRTISVAEVTATTATTAPADRLSPSLARRLPHFGRDGGGTYSGHNSAAVSDADSSEDEHSRRRLARLKLGGHGQEGDGNEGDGNDPLQHHHHHHHKYQQREQSRMGRGTRANKLGDHPHSSDGEHDADDEQFARAEQEERSVQGSVF